MSKLLHSPFLDMTDEEFTKKYSPESLVDDGDFGCYKLKAEIEVRSKINSNKALVTSGGYQIVGNGEVSKPYCGKFLRFTGCCRVELHHNNLVGNFEGKVYVRPIHESCDNPNCPICYLEWAKREACNAERRLKEASKRYGQVEHIVCSVPKSDYGLNLEALRAKAKAVLESRGVIGAFMIFHHARYNSYEEAKRKNVSMGWYWSPHFHCLGFLRGGYGRCRGCPYGSIPSLDVCGGCDGFEAVTRRLNLGYVDAKGKRHDGDGYLVKVLGERKTVGGTAWYQLNHASVKVGVKRFHVATWWGVVSYRKLKVSAEFKKRVCPICSHELVPLRYVGNERIVLDKWSPLFKKEFYADLFEGDKQVWFEDSKSG
jgi:hypothetical protein